MVFLPSTLMDATELPKVVLFNSVDCKTKVSSASFAFSCHFLWFFTMNNKPGGISVNTGSSVNNSVPLVLLPTALQKPQRLRQESTGTLFFPCMLHTGRMLSQRASGFEPLFSLLHIWSIAPRCCDLFYLLVLPWPSPGYLVCLSSKQVVLPVQGGQTD